VTGLSPVRPLAAVPEVSVVGATIPAMAPITPPSLFVGRTRELARLEHLLEQAVAGSATGVLVAGDAGVGKTRLTTELLRWAQERGVVAVVGHCVDLGAGGLPYLPFAEALTGIARAGDLADADEIARAAAAAVRSVAAEHPVLYRVTGRIERAPADDGGDRMPLYEAVLESIHAVTDGVAPMLLALEDLHWADAATRDLLRFVLSRLSDERLLVVGTYRSDDLHRRHPLRPLLAELVRLPRVERLDVQPFDVTELRDYLSMLHGGDLPEAVVADIRGRSEGNAYYAGELLAAADDELAGRGRRVALPEQLADVLLARLERLPAGVQQVARVASVAGRRVPDALLRAAVGLPTAEVEEALRETVAHHVLVPDGDDRYAFRHALLQEAIYADLLPGERVRLHAAYARLLAEQGDGASAADLARHCMAALDLPGALAASVRAAEEAVAVLAPAEALAHYDQALQLWAAVPEGSRPPELHAVALTERAAAAAGAAGELDRAVALASEAVTLAAAGGDRLVEAAARGRLAHHLYEADRREACLVEIDRVRSLLEGTGPSPVRVWAAAVEARIRSRGGSLAETEALVEPALEEARALGLASAEADLLISLALHESEAGDVDEAAERLARATRQARTGGDESVALRAVYNLAINRLDSGDLSEAERILEEGLADAERAGLALTVFGVESLNMLLQALVMAGEWDKALATHARVRVRVPGVQRDWLQVPTLTVIAARDPQAALPLGEHLTALAEHEPWSSHLVLGPVADAQRWLGDGEAAARTVRRIIELKIKGADEWGLGQLLAIGIGLGGLADAAAAAAVRQDDMATARLRAEGAGFIERARQVAERGQPRLATLGPEGRAWLTRAEAEWARLEGRDDPEIWERAVEGFAFGHVYEVGRSRRHLAEVLVTRGNRAAAAEQARLARETAVSLQARPLREAIDALARRTRLDLGGGPAASSVLTPREQEVMRLVAQGMTNRQIGRRLFISEKTASVHVSNVLAKLGAGGRTEAVAIAHRRGLLVDDPLDEAPAR
jgi:DNA-binding CsgD family transcriptional regulator/tetratricopeptide (TPR) repeat protein